MKTRKILPVLTFLAGIVAGGMLIGLMSFSGPNPPADPISIDSIAANTLFKAYMSTKPAPYNDTIKGLFIDVEQYKAMYSIYSKNAKLNGFRVYYGLVAPSTKVAVVVGTMKDATGVTRDFVKAPYTIYRSSATGVGPCPDVCDNTSPIMK